MGVPGSYLVATDKSYIGDLVKIAGGENVIKVNIVNIFRLILKIC